MEAGTLQSPPRHSPLTSSALSRLPDRALRWLLFGVSAAVLALVAYFFISLYDDARPILTKVGVGDFVFRNDWNVAQAHFGAWALVSGTLITAAIALLIGVPIAVAVAVYVVELAPSRVRYPLTILVELLAAVPSVVYGLWGVFVLIPRLKPAEQWVSDTFSFLPFVGGQVSGPNYFIGGLILAIMILPIVSSISREVLTTVPAELKEGALALGATRWEMIRLAVLPYARGGITGAAMLGLGRAVGETIAVTLVIGNAPQIGDSVFSQGYTLAAVVANEFGEAAADPIHRAALIGCGLVLFVVTLLINAAARAYVTRAARIKSHSGPVSDPAPPPAIQPAAGGAA